MKSQEQLLSDALYLHLVEFGEKLGWSEKRIDEEYRKRIEKARITPKIKSDPSLVVRGRYNFIRWSPIVRGRYTSEGLTSPKHKRNEEERIKSLG